MAGLTSLHDLKNGMDVLQMSASSMSDHNFRKGHKLSTDAGKSPHCTIPLVDGTLPPTSTIKERHCTITTYHCAILRWRPPYGEVLGVGWGRALNEVKQSAGPKSRSCTSHWGGSVTPVSRCHLWSTGNYAIQDRDRKWKLWLRLDRDPNEFPILPWCHSTLMYIWHCCLSVGMDRFSIAFQRSIFLE